MNRRLKPRTVGLIEIRGPYDSVVCRRYLEDLFEGFSAYADILKFTGGSFSLMPRKVLVDLIELCSPEPGQGLHRLLPTRLVNLPLSRLGLLVADSGRRVDEVPEEESPQDRGSDRQQRDARADVRDVLTKVSALRSGDP